MYAKLFTSIYQGTLRGNAHGLLVFTNLLAHCDKFGEVDIHPRAIAEEVGLTVDQVRVSLGMLEAPDDESRSPDLSGRRIVRLDEHRDWGWKVVNYIKYRAIRDEDDRREQNRIAQEKWRNKNKPPSASVVSDKPIQRQRHIQKEETLSTPIGVSPRKRGSASVEGFEFFWKSYPRKTAKQAALKAFTKLAPSADFLDSILEAIKKQRKTDQWADGIIPHAATWLNGRRWEDESITIAADQAIATGAEAAAKTSGLLAEQEAAGRAARTPEATAARLAAMARLKGVPV